MKKKLVALVASLALIGGLSYHYADQKIVAEAWYGEYNHAIYDNVDDLYKDSTLVVSVTATSNTKELSEQNFEYTDRYSVTEVNIDKVIKDQNNAVANSSSIPIIERAFTVDNGIVPGKTKLVADGYTTLVPGNKYILFLNWSEKRNAYWIHAVSQGKISIDGKDIKENKFASKDETFQKLKDSVNKKFAH
ncbi:hypothetical protein [Paenibacillus sp. YYML68]|uniref:hypothetical protein n=1 Tax=Paenibacillus sp. YYML68 TaxID=2909250 RepID=UPI0024907DF1|nr:hypothetical protein [Paenibacillus sp. YYML68]